MTAQQQRQNKIDEIKNRLYQLKLIDKSRKAAQGVKNTIDTYNSFNNTNPSLRGSTLNNVMQPTQDVLKSTPSLQNGATTLASDFSANTMPTTINSLGNTALGTGTSTLNAGAGLSSGVGNLGTIGTAAASEASGAGGMGLASLGNVGANVATTVGGNALAGAGTGAGAALGGAGAAGAAGGMGAAGAGSAALGALGPVGAGLAAAYMIYNMIAGAKKEKDQEAMREAEKASAQSIQEAEQTTANSMQKLQQGANQKKQELLGMFNDENKGVLGQLPNLPNATVKDPQQPTQQIAMPNNSTGAASNVADGLNTASNTAGLVSDIAGMVNGDIPVSQSISPSVTDNPVEDNPIRSDLVEQIAGAGRGNDMLSDTPYTVYNEMTPPYIDQYDGLSNTDLAMQAKDINDASIDRIKPTDKYNNEAITEDLPVDKNSKLKGGLMQSVKNGLQNFASGYKDNSENGIIDGDLLNGRTGQKTFGQRLGEVVGTGARVLRNPYVQGGIAGALYAKDKGDALYGLGKGWEWAQNRAKNNAYADALRKAGVNVPNGILGGISGTDAAAISNVDMLPAKKDYYKGRAAQGLASAGLKPDGTPYTAKDVYEMRDLASGEDIDETTVINPYFKGEQTRYNKGQDVKVSENNVTASENYVKNGENKVKAAQLGYDTAVQYGKNKNIPTRQDVYHHSDKNKQPSISDEPQPKGNKSKKTTAKMPNQTTGTTPNGNKWRLFK